MEVEFTGKFITVSPIKPKPKKSGDSWDYPAWRFHIWELGDYTYEQIEYRVSKGLLKPFICPNRNCSCAYPKL